MSHTKTFGVADEVDPGKIILIEHIDGSFDVFETSNDRQFQKVNGAWCLCGSIITQQKNGTIKHTPAMVPTSDIAQYKPNWKGTANNKK